MRIVDKYTEVIEGQPHLITVYEGNRILVEPVNVPNYSRAAIERNRTMRGNSKRKSGG